MRSVIHDLLVAYMENKASECQIYEGKPAVLRIEGASCEIPDFAPDDTKFLELAGNLLPDEQIKKLESNDDGEDFILEDFLLEEDGAVIIDYKSDRIDDAEELAERYREQLRLYREAVPRIFSLPVKTCLIYSFHLGKSITVY